MLLEELNGIAEKEKTGRKQICIRCCMSAGCMSSQAAEIKKALDKAVADKQLTDKIEVRRVGCMGFCGEGPMVSIESEGLLYEHVTPENAPSIIDALAGGTTEVRRGDSQMPFFARQMLVVRAQGGRVDPDYPKRSARTRRSRFPHRSEMGDGCEIQRRSQIRHLQWRRGRPRRVHGSKRARKRSP